MGKIGVYGGSFNPPHMGHIQAASEMISALDLDRLLLVPAASPPHKSLPSGSPTAEMRLEMLKLAANGLKKAEICDLELRREPPSYTVDTLRQIQERYPDQELYLLMGTDMFLSFDQWREPKKIAHMATLVTVRRSEGDHEEEAQIQSQAKKLRDRFHAKVIRLDNEILEMSSTEIRRMLCFDCAEDYLAPEVMDFVRQRGLYGVGTPVNGLPFEQLKKVSLSLHDPKRVPHVMGCSQTAAHLARLWGADEELAARAGILHDVTKALSRTAQLRLCEKYGMMTSDFERKHYKLLHARTGAAVAQHVFGEPDAVVQAIYWHTTGKANMTLLEKILYIADYMEPHRDFDGVEKLRRLTETDLDAALLCGFEMSIDLLKSEGKPLDRYTVEARDYLLGERTKA